VQQHGDEGVQQLYFQRGCLKHVKAPHILTSLSGWLRLLSLQCAMKGSRSMGPGGKVERHIRMSCQPRSVDAVEGLSVVCFASWQ